MFTKHTKIIAIIAGSTFLGSLALLLGSQFALHIMETKLEEQQLKIAQAENNQQQLASLVKLVENTEVERTELHSYLLRNDEVIDFLALVETLGAEQGVELNTSSLNTSALSGPFEDLTLVVTVEGSYDSVLHMLRLFENLPYQSHVSRVTTSRTTAGTDRWSGTFELHVTKYKEL